MHVLGVINQPVPRLMRKDNLMKLAVKPFRATRYNSSRIKDYSKVVCPPYDVISKKQLKVLRKKSPYNFSHIIIADNGNYKRSSVLLQNLVKNKILIEDKEENFYLYEQKFKVEGKKFNRFGILLLLKMDDNGIFPHEHTLRGPKEDRKRIIKATQANLSPVFIIAAKYLGSLHKVHAQYSRQKPHLSLKDDEGNYNRLWKINDKVKIAQLTKAITNSKLVIADGHHRFEISFDYFKKNKGKFKDLNYILAFVTDYQKGLNILPTHRVVSLRDKPGVVLAKLGDNFEIKQVSKEELGKKIKAKGEFCFGIYCAGKFYFLKLGNKKILNKIPNKVYKQLDTYVFHQLVLPLFDRIGEIEYTHSIAQAVQLAGKKKTAFILRAVSLDSVFKISSKGFRLPQKSTYFYPKILSGIVLRRFEKKGAASKEGALE